MRLRIAEGASVNLSSLRATVHLGAHADAESHYADGDGVKTMEAMDLDRYVGRCRVLRVNVERGERVAASELPELDGVERLLVTTGTHPDPAVIPEDFAGLSEEFVAKAAAAGVRLIGVDAPSVDLFTSKSLEAHNACLRNDVAILEGLALADVDEGEYELIALPLKLEGFDGSPVRAVLRPLGEGA